MNKKILFTILGIAVMILLIVFVSNKPAEESPVKEPSEEESTEDMPISDESKVVKDDEEVEKNDKIISPTDCGKAVLKDSKNQKGFDCIVEASKACDPAFITISLSYNYLKMVDVTAAAFSEIRGPEEDKCIFYMRLDEIDLRFSLLVPKKKVDEGETLADQLRGTEGICRFETADLTALLYKWREGNFSSEDFDVGECEGEYFDQDALF